MRQLRRLIVFALLFGAMSCALSAQNANLHHAIDQTIRKEVDIDFSLVPGVLVGVIDGENTFIENFGQSMSSDSLYELGSVTKPFVYWLTEQLMDSMAWSLDASVCDFLPDTMCTAKIKSLTLRHVLHHRSGLPLWPPQLGVYEEDLNDPYRLYTPDYFARDIQAMPTSPGQFLYSHTGYALLQWVFDRAGGQDAFSKMKFTDVLAMKNTTWRISDDQVASGYGMDGQPRPPWHVNAFQTSFGLKSSMRDVLRFVRSISERLPSADPIDLRKTKKEVNRLSRKGEFLIRAGWFLVPFGSGVACFHTGRTGGHHIAIAFVPERMKGVVVISNGALGSENLALRVLDMIQ